MLDSDDTLYFSEYNEYTAAYEQLTTLKGVVLGDMPAFIVREKACTQKIMIMDEAERIPQLVEEYTKRACAALSIFDGAQFLDQLAARLALREY